MRWIRMIPLVLAILIAGFIVTSYFADDPEGPAPTPVLVTTTIIPKGTPSP
jgi:hypothetical protein